MESQLDTLRLIAPEFAAVDNTTVESMLQLSALIIDPLAYPENIRGLALVYQACILLSQRSASANGTAGATGDLTMEKEGDLQRSYSAGSSNDRFGAKNQYEIMLDKLSVNLFMGGITRMADVVPAL